MSSALEHLTTRRRLGRVVAASLLALLVCLVPIVGACSREADAPGTSGTGIPAAALTVSAASDLALALDDIVQAFADTTGVEVSVNLGSSGQLAQQIAAGAPVDVFFSADRGYVQELIDNGLVDPDDTALYALGRLTIWTRAESALRLDSLEDLAGPDVRRVAIANPDHAPYGRAAKQALEDAGLWEELQGRLVLAENVLQALQFADSGNTDVALVARSLSVEGDGRWVLVPDDSYEPIEQMAAVIASTPARRAAREFIEFVNGPTGRPIMQEHGFLLPDETDSGG